MLDLRDLSLAIGPREEEQTILSEVSASFPERHFAAIVGPSGCGKSTLLKVIAGIHESTSGSVFWKEHDLAEEDLEPHEIGYVPQFGIAYDLLTVWESVETAMRLRVGGPGGEERDTRVDRILAEVGLQEIPDRPVRVLSGGQKRRLALALEMVSSPSLMLCDEVTSGLDPKAEDEIVHLLRELSREDDRIVFSVTHSLRHLGLYDSILVLYEGHVAYHGPPEFLCHYFNVESAEELFPRLALRPAVDWRQSWRKHRNAYDRAGRKVDSTEQTVADETEEAVGFASEQGFQRQTAAEAAERLRELFEHTHISGNADNAEVSEAAGDEFTDRRQDVHGMPGFATQFSVLLERRWKLLFRDRGQLLLQLALLFGFPCLVVVFAWDGLPQMKNLSMGYRGNVVEQVIEQAAFSRQASEVGSLVSGLVMFQVILLTLMGSNNSAREIAGERRIFEKEKFGGVRPSAYVVSKVVYLAALVLAQSLWMAVFVNAICKFEGAIAGQILSLVLVNAAMTAVCLAISSWMNSPEQASLVSVYLVGFQLPLSGAVLALPDFLGTLTRPFIAAYWGWSGFLQTMLDSRHYDAVQAVTQTEMSPIQLCFWVLGAQIAIGVAVAYMGCKHSRWD